MVKYIRRWILIILSIIILLKCCNINHKIHNEINLSFLYIINKNVYIDEAFSTGEEEEIKKSLTAWENASDNRIKFNILFKYYEPGELDDFINKKSFNNSLFIWRMKNNNLSLYLKNKLKIFSGIYDNKGNIVIFVDNINGLDTTFYNVVRHELGHALGLSHSISYNRSTMKVSSNEISDCISKEDTDRLCLIYNCIGKPECY